MSTLKDRLQSVLGGEDLDVAPIVEVIPVEEQAVVLADGEISNAEVVVAEHEEEITEIQHDIDVIEERLEDIEENVGGLEAMMSGESEWNPALAMKMYKDARKLTDRTFGQDEERAPIDGVESFADATTAQLTIIEGLEDIKEKASAAGTAIVNFFKNLYKSVIAAFVGLFDRLKGVEKRSDAIIARLGTLADDKIKDTIKLGSWNAYLRVDGGTDPLKQLTNIRAGVKELGEALNASKGESAKTIIDNALAKIGSLTTDKKTVTSSAEQTTSVGKIAYIEFKWTVPKVLPALRNASLTYKPTEGAKTSGDYKSGYNKSKLVTLAKAIKTDAAAAREDKFSASKLNTVREKAIATVKAIAGTGETRSDAQALRAAHTASNNIARTLTRYQGDVLIAGQKFIGAHF